MRPVSFLLPAARCGGKIDMLGAGKTPPLEAAFARLDATLDFEALIGEEERR
jgi:hypothetical protein